MIGADLQPLLVLFQLLAIDIARGLEGVAPSLVRDDTTAMWIAFDEAGEAVQRSAEIDDVLALLLDGARQWIAWSALPVRVE